MLEDMKLLDAACFSTSLCNTPERSVQLVVCTAARLGRGYACMRVQWRGTMQSKE